MSNPITVTSTVTDVNVSLEAKMTQVVLDGAKVNVSGSRTTEVTRAVHDILATINALNHLDYRDEVINVGGVSYPVADYQICPEFVGFLVPRRVSITNDFDAVNLSKQVTLVNSGNVLKPHEFREAEQIVMSIYKRDVQGPVTAESYATHLITDAKVVSNGEFVAETAGGRQIPVFLTIELWKNFHYGVPMEDYLYQFLLDVKEALRK